jgi:hypothetical protein
LEGVVELGAASVVEDLLGMNRISARGRLAVLPVSQSELDADSKAERAVK